VTKALTIGRQSRRTCRGSWSSYDVQLVSIVTEKDSLRRVPVATARLPALVDRVQTCPRAERLETSRSSMRLLELVEDFGKVGLTVSAAYLDQVRRRLTSDGSRRSKEDVMSCSLAWIEGSEIDWLTSYIFCSLIPVNPMAIDWASKGWLSAIDSTRINIAHHKSSLMNRVIDDLRFELGISSKAFTVPIN
jgi:hypothetical protein